mgnify:CR=1 FL=1
MEKKFKLGPLKKRVKKDGQEYLRIMESLL